MSIRLPAAPPSALYIEIEYRQYRVANIHQHFITDAIAPFSYRAASFAIRNTIIEQRLMSHSRWPSPSLTPPTLHTIRRGEALIKSLFRHTIAEYRRSGHLKMPSSHSIAADISRHTGARRCDDAIAA